MMFDNEERAIPQLFLLTQEELRWYSLAHTLALSP
jgi:hypothetical protein